MQEQEHNDCTTITTGPISPQELQIFIIENYEKIFAVICSVLVDYDQGEAEFVFDRVLEEVAAKHAMVDHKKGNMLSWIKGIAKYRAIDRYRYLHKNKVNGFIEYDDIIDASYEQSTYQSPDSFADKDEGEQDQIKIIYQELGKLKLESKKIVLDVGVYGIPMNEFAEAEGIPLSTAKSRYYRAVEKLEKVLLEYEEFSEYR